MNLAKMSTKNRSANQGDSTSRPSEVQPETPNTSTKQNEALAQQKANTISAQSPLPATPLCQAGIPSSTPQTQLSHPTAQRNLATETYLTQIKTQERSPTRPSMNTTATTKKHSSRNQLDMRPETMGSTTHPSKKRKLTPEGRSLKTDSGMDMLIGKEI
jgi:hypothetical protein